MQSNSVVTAGAALSHLDLALALIRRASPELANLTARYLVVDVRTSQSIYSIPDHLAHADPLTQQFERWARGRLAEGFSLDQAAEARVARRERLRHRLLLRAVAGRAAVLERQTVAIFEIDRLGSVVIDDIDDVYSIGA